MYDVITVGSATVDVFLGTKSKNIEIEQVHAHQDVCMPIGAKILIDRIVTDTGGGGTNSATAFSRLGLKTGWIGKLGNDLNTKTILHVLEKERIDFLGGKDKGTTGFSVILTGLAGNRTILAYKGVNDELSPSDVRWPRLKTKWFYCSSMMGKSWKTLTKIIAFAKKNGIKYAFNPSLYLAEKGLKALAPIVNGCDLLVLNKEEAQALLRSKKQGFELAKELQRHVKLAVVTDGQNPVHAYNGFEHYKLIPSRIRVVEPTGAGDAFAAGLVAGILIKKDLEYALRLGFAEASSVMQHFGAKEKLLGRQEAERLIRQRPVRIVKRKC